MRIQIPLLKTNQLGKKGTLGWFMLEIKTSPARIKEIRYPVIQCPLCNERSSMTDHSIKSDGEVNASIACRNGCPFHEWGILENWPIAFLKAVGSLTIEPV